MHVKAIQQLLLPIYCIFNVDSCTWLETANKSILTLQGRVSGNIKTAQTSLSGLESLWSHGNKRW